jgi:hypothetical protein
MSVSMTVLAMIVIAMIMSVTMSMSMTVSMSMSVSMIHIMTVSMVDVITVLTMLMIATVTVCLIVIYSGLAGKISMFIFLNNHICIFSGFQNFLVIVLMDFYGIKLCFLLII